MKKNKCIESVETVKLMQREVAIKELVKYNRLKEKIIPNLENKLEYLDNQLCGLTAMQYSDMPKAEGKRENYTKETLIDEKIHIESKLETYKSFITYIDIALSKIDSTDRKILIDYWGKEKFERMKLYDLCKKNKISQTMFTRRKYESLDTYIMDVGLKGDIIW